MYIDSMVEFMRTIAQKRETAGDTPKADTLWSKYVSFNFYSEFVVCT